ncbi:MAG: hypothetical protein Q7R30_16405 [Acidobacteriota bacterium]|nr:hypothetical protein [Acidobacteriota bacterium]
MNTTQTPAAIFAAMLVALACIAWASPVPDRVTDRATYEATAERMIVPDCTDLHCFRVLVAIAAILQVPVARRVPASLVLVAAGACLGAFFAHAHGYPGRFSIHAVPLAGALAICGVAKGFGR